MVKIDTGKVKKWMILQIDNKLFKVTDMGHTHMGRGGATDTFKVKDIVSGKTNVFTYNAWTTLEQADVQTNTAIFLYEAGGSYTFMENDTGEMYELDKEKIDDVADYLKENLDCYLMLFEGDVLGVILPATITYTIQSTVPGIKWNRSNSGTKPATIETGLDIQVPLHKNEGDSVTLNTLTGETS